MLNPGTDASSPDAPLVIGVDGGGTKTAAAIARVDSAEDVHIIARGEAGPGNLQSLTLQQVADHAQQAIDRALRDCSELPGSVQAGSVQAGSVAAIAFCMAGAGNEPLRQRFEQWARRQPWARRLVVTHDARALIEAGTTQGCGVALIAGTGSLAYARTAAGDEARCGGWGSILGDEGSAYWLVIEAVRAATRAIDGRAPQTRLVEVLGQWLQAGEPRQWTARLRSMTPGAIAAAAPLVSQAAAEGDAVAVELIACCADQLSQLVIPLAQRWFAGQTLELALAGGLILQNAALRQQVLQRIADAGVSLAASCDVRHPVEGAVRLAARAASSDRWPNG